MIVIMITPLIFFVITITPNGVTVFLPVNFASVEVGMAVGVTKLVMSSKMN